MTTIVRMFESEQVARDAAEELNGDQRFDGLSGRFYTPFAAQAVAPGSASAIDDAVEAGTIAGSQGRACKRGLDRGLSVVIVQCAFGNGGRAEARLGAYGPIEPDAIPEVRDYDTALFSELLGIPTLTDRKTPLSDLLGLKTRKKPEVTSLGLPRLMSNATPLSSTFGIPLSKKPDVTSLGFARLMGNATPLSSTLGLPLSKKPEVTSLGFPRLMKNPTPLSSAFGLKTLTTEDQDD